MPDKLRSTAPLKISFAQGEQPSAAKLNVMSTQPRNALAVVEKVVGDVWNQSGDSILNAYPLQIANLARTVGEQKYMNPIFYPPTSNFTFVEQVGFRNMGKIEAFLVFKPLSLTNITAVAGSTNLTSKKSSRDAVDAAGDWFVDIATGKLYSFSPLDETDKLSYVVDVLSTSSWAIKTDTMPNVIPDYRQDDFTGCRISSSGGTYYIHLPPRQPLNIAGNTTSVEPLMTDKPHRYPINTRKIGSTTHAGNTEVEDNLDTSVQTDPDKKLWQSSAANALNDKFYRYRLPKEITNVLDSLGAGVALPSGFLYLWDQTTGTIIDNVTFKTTADPWIFEVATESIDLDKYDSADETEASYNTRFSIITVGSPLARTVWTLMKLVLGHNHGEPEQFSEPISHSSLKHVNPEPNSAYPTSVLFPPSKWTNDDHTYLLSRAGAQTDSAKQRDVFNNAMLGHLLLANSSTSNYLDDTAPDDTFKIYFGNITGSYLFGAQNSAADGVEIRATSNGTSNGFSGSSGGVGKYGLYGIGTGVGGGGVYGYAIEISSLDPDIDSYYGVYGFSVNTMSAGSEGPNEVYKGVFGKAARGIGVHGQSTYGYGVVAEGGSYTSYSHRPALRIVPQSSTNLTPQEGDVYYDSSAHKLKVRTNSGWETITSA